MDSPFSKGSRNTLILYVKLGHSSKNNTRGAPMNLPDVGLNAPTMAAELAL
nr:hypothetical protein [Neisseria subflava]